MIGSLRGVLLERTSDEVLIEVAGVGWRVSVAPAVAMALGELGGEVFVHIHHHIREDAQTLYGFTSADERVAFVTLLSAHGLRLVLATDDIAGLCLVPGVGKKTAARLLVELKSKLDVPEGDIAATVAAANDTPVNGTRRDVREALLGLGYGDDEIQATLRDVPDEGDVSAQLKDALQRLAVSS